MVVTVIAHTAGGAPHTLYDSVISIHPYTSRQQEGGRREGQKGNPLYLNDSFRKSNTPFQLATQRPELSHMATLGTKETVKYMVVLNPGSDSKEEGKMDDEIHSLPHFSRRVEVFRISN